MTSRRRYPLPTARGTRRASTAPTVAPAVRGGLAVAGVAAFVSTLIVTGRATGIDIAAAGTAVEGRAVTAAVASGPLIATSPSPLAPAAVGKVLGPLHLSAAELRGGRVTRAHVRTAHEWVRPNHGQLTSCYCMRWGS